MFEKLPRAVASAAPAAAAIAALVLATAARADPSLSTNPPLPAFGQAVGIELQNDGQPIYLPATRFKRVGGEIVLEFEFARDYFGPGRPDFGNVPVPLGELPPGNHPVHAKVIDMATGGTTRILSGSIAVMPPQEWGMYTLPAWPQAFSEAYATLRSAAYFDPESMRLSVSGNVIRVDFEYHPDAPTGGPAPAGTTSYHSIPLPGLQPGTYVLEGWGRPKAGGDAQRYFTREFQVAATTPVLEYYSKSLDHYFMAAAADEVGLLDNGGRGDWMRTGQSFKAWTRASDAPPTAKPVCRFYASGPNSHFFTGDAAECEKLRSLEAQQRADANARGVRFTGWQYEGIAFYALVPHEGTCPPNTQPVWRAYNGRAQQNDTNHRFMVDAALRAAMRVEWIDEGPAFCSPP